MIIKGIAVSNQMMILITISIMITTMDMMRNMRILTDIICDSVLEL